MSPTDVLSPPAAPRPARPHERGVALIIVILIVTFLMAIGIGILSVSGTSSRVAGNIRLQERAFNAAEAGFDQAWRFLNDQATAGALVDFSGLYRTNFGGGAGFDDPLDANYFRKKTDEEIWEDVVADPSDVLVAPTAMPQDPYSGFLAFLINDEPPGATPNENDALLVCIGRGPQRTYKRLEIVLEIQP